MKKEYNWLRIKLVFAFTLGVITAILLSLKVNNNTTKDSNVPKVDLPEEYRNITSNKTQPDTVLAYSSINKDTVYIEFNYAGMRYKQYTTRH